MSPPNTPLARLDAALSRRAGRPVVIVLVALILAAPLWLFADSLRYYRVQGDDFAFIGASRTFPRAVENLFVPHNAHIVPAWRLLTWSLVAWAGRIAEAPRVLGTATFAVVPMVMMAVGLLVARETGRTSAGLVAMAFAGITSVLKSPATWYSAGQTLWAGLGVLLTLVFLQSWRRSGGVWRLALAAVCAAVAGGFWTIGHVAGPAGAAYLFADRRPRSRRAALVPLIATIVAVALSFGLGARKIEVEIRFEGKDGDHAINFWRGASHSLQSISETLVIGNMGVAAETSAVQAGVLTLALFGLWLWTFRRGGWPTPLECASGVIMGLGYYVSWTFRSYYTWENLRGVVPWYDAIPHLGAVLFVAGWWSRVWQVEVKDRPLSWGGVLGVATLTLALLAVHEPRSTTLFMAELPKMTKAESEVFLIRDLQRMRCVSYAKILQTWQREHFVRLDNAEARAKKLGIGLDLIHEAFGRVLAPGLPKQAYDAADMLDLPRKGKETNPAVPRAQLAAYFAVTPEPPFPLDDLLRMMRGGR